jgi:hypothetical protein
MKFVLGCAECASLGAIGAIANAAADITATHGSFQDIDASIPRADAKTTAAYFSRRRRAVASADRRR